MQNNATTATPKMTACRRNCSKLSNFIPLCLPHIQHWWKICHRNL